MFSRFFWVNNWQALKKTFEFETPEQTIEKHFWTKKTSKTRIGGGYKLDANGHFRSDLSEESCRLNKDLSGGNMGYIPNFQSREACQKNNHPFFHGSLGNTLKTKSNK